MAFSVRDILRLNRRRPRRGAKTVMRLPQIIQAATAAVGGNPELSVVLKSDDYTMVEADDVVVFTHSSGTKTLTLDAVANTRLRIFVKTVGAATVAVASSSNVNGSSSVTVGGGTMTMGIIVSTGSTYWMMTAIMPP